MQFRLRTLLMLTTALCAAAAVLGFVARRLDDEPRARLFVVVGVVGGSALAAAALQAWLRLKAIRTCQKRDLGVMTYGEGRWAILPFAVLAPGLLMQITRPLTHTYDFGSRYGLLGLLTLVMNVILLALLASPLLRRGREVYELGDDGIIHNLFWTTRWDKFRSAEYDPQENSIELVITTYHMIELTCDERQHAFIASKVPTSVVGGGAP